MDALMQGVLGVQLTLVGLFLATFFEGVGGLPIMGLLLGAVGTAVVFGALLRSR